LPIPLLLATIIGLRVADLHTSYESPNLMLGLNLVFSVLASLFIASLVGRSFLIRGTPGLLLLGCGVVVWGVAGFVAGTAGLVAAGGRDFAGITVTIHNSCVWLAGLCYLTGVVLSFRPSSAMPATGLWLAGAYSLAVVAVGAVTLVAVEGWTPPFFIQGEGGTLIRQVVLGSAIAMFLITALLLMAGYRRSASSFTYWYSLALVLIATGLFGVMLQASAGSLLGWTGRAAQFLGGVYMLFAAIASVRETRAWELPLEEALQRERSFVAAVLKTVGALVVVLDRQGRIVSFNRACEEATGYSFAEVKGRCFWDFLLAAEEIEQINAVFGQLRASQFPNEHDNYWVAKDGSRRLLHWTNGCLTDSSGAVEYVIGTGVDVTERKRAEEALRQSEERYRGVVEHTTAIVLRIDPSGVINFANSRALEFFGYTAEELIGRHAVGTIVPPQETSGRDLAAMVEQIGVDPDGFHSNANENLCKDGRRVWLEWTNSGTYGADGRLKEFLSVGIDATARKQAEETAAAVHRQVQNLINNTPAVVYAFDLEHRFLLANSAVAELFHTTPEQMIGKRRHEFMPKEDADWHEENDRKAIDAGRALEFEEHSQLPGRSITWLTTKFPLRDAQGRIYAVAGISTDVSDRKKAEATLREKEADLREAQRLARIGSWHWDATTDVTSASDELLRIYGFDPATQTMPNFKDQRGRCYPVEDWDRINAAVQRTLDTGVGYELDVCLIRNSTTVWATTRGEVVRDAQGQIMGLRGTVQEITERKQAEEALAEQAGLLDLSNDAILMRDANDRISYWNRGATGVYGYTAEEAAGKIPHDLLKTVFPEPLDHIIEKLRRDGHWTGELIHTRKDGSQITTMSRWVLDCDEHGKSASILETNTDISEHKLAEKALRKSEQEFRTLAESIPQIVWATRPDGWNIYFNQQWVDYTGLTLDESYGHGWITPFHPDDRQRGWDAWQRATQRDETYLLECRLRRADGVYRWWLIHGSPVRDANGEIQKWLGTCTDIDEFKKAEQLLQQAKTAAEAANEAKSQFLANMSHELRTPMNAILGMIDVALPKAVDPTVQDCLQTAKGSADLLLTLLNDLLDSAKIESGKLELESAPFSLRRMLDQITRVLSVRASEKGLAFYCRMPDGTPDAVVGDRMRLQQVLLNLAGNAIKFTERGDVEVGLHALSQDGEACLEFAVRDTGIGIPPSGVERLFQPFAQADASMARRFGGTGLGLAISRSLVEMMGGRIWAESELGVGTTISFTVRLPLAKELLADYEAAVTMPAMACAQLRILLVEDNPANQKLATYILQDRGHLIEIAGDGQEAVYLTERNHYDVILMDVQLPGMNGLEATAAIRRRENGNDRVPIIAMTAHAMRGDRDQCLAAGMDGYLSKPVNAQEMIGLVESLARGVAPPTQRVAATPRPAETSPQATAVVFNTDEALAHCFNSTDMLREMIQCFFDEVDNSFPKMRRALEQGDLVEVGRLGHRMKGTVVYLGAESAKRAALRVERFCKSSGGTAAEAEEAINALEHECVALRAALIEHPLAAEKKQGDSR
jgi:PAS domain S-box-containing protein